MSEHSTIGDERRQSFRIDDDIYLDYRPLPADASVTTQNDTDMTGVCRGLMQLRELNIQAGHALANIRKHNSEVAHYLSILDKKIETLTRMTGAIGLGHDIQPTTRANLGSGGIAFHSDKPLENGQRLLLKLVLFPSHLCLQLSGHVIYSRAQDPDGSYWTGVDFEPLPESEYDALIRHLLEKQSAQLRQERERE